DGKIYPTQYRAIGADADIGDKTNFFGARTLDLNDLAQFTSIPNVPGRLVLGQLLYNLAGSEKLFPATVPNPAFGAGLATAVASFIFVKNDLVVSQPSSFYGGSFQPIFGPLSRNHSSVGDICVAGGDCPNDRGAETAVSLGGVLDEIKRIQPI